jgi:hypothetical protein
VINGETIKNLTVFSFELVIAMTSSYTFKNQNGNLLLFQS